MHNVEKGQSYFKNIPVWQPRYFYNIFGYSILCMKGQKPTNCLSVTDHFAELALKGLKVQWIMKKTTRKFNFGIIILMLENQQHIFDQLDQLNQLEFTFPKSAIETLGKRCEICSKLTIKTPKRRQWRRSGVFTANLEPILRISSTSIADFKHVFVYVTNSTYRGLFFFILKFYF